MVNRQRVALVTGAARGIGYAIGLRFAQDGYAVALVDINKEAVEQAAQTLAADTGAKVIGLSCDVSIVAQLKETVDTCAKSLGGLDVVVNNAGILFSNPIEEVTEAEWDKVMDVNLKSMFFLVQQALPYLKSGISPRVINISSLAGRMGGYEVGLPYSASKGGALALTMGMARRLAPFQITVNSVCPSATESEMIMDWTEEQRQNLFKDIPLGRAGKPTEIASAVCFLASKEAAYITGLLMDVNGGAYMG